MPRTITPIVLNPEEQARLEQWKSAHSTPQQVALRCRIILAVAAGEQSIQIARRLKVSRPTIGLWRKRVGEMGVDQVWEIAPGRGRKHSHDQAKRDSIIEATLQTKPKGMTHWSCRTLAEQQGVSTTGS